MTQSDRMHQDIGRGEEWLARVSPPVPAPDTNALKVRVRIALDEHWLAGQADPVAPADLDERIRVRLSDEASCTDVVRGGFVEAGSAPRGRSPARLFRWAGGALALAAALVLSFRLMPEPGGAAASLSACDAFLVYDSQDLLLDEFALVDETLLELEYSEDLLFSFSYVDGELDDLREDIDNLLSSDLDDTDWL